MRSCFQLDKGGCELIQESSQQFWQFDVNAQPWPNSHQLIPGLLFWSQRCHYHPHHKNTFKMLMIYGQAFWLLLWITLVHQRLNAETLYLNLFPPESSIQVYVAEFPTTGVKMGWWVPTARGVISGAILSGRDICGWGNTALAPVCLRAAGGYSLRLKAF